MKKTHSIRLAAWFFLFCVVNCCGLLYAQTSVDIRIDSLELLVGQQTGLTLDVTADRQSKITFPDIKKGAELTPGVEVVDVAAADTQYLNDGARMTVTQKYVITSFDSALYYLPPMEVQVNGKVYKSKNLALNVLAIPVDTVHINNYDGPRDVMDLPFSWKEDWEPIFWYSLLLVLLVLLTLYLFMRYKDNKPIIRIVKIAPKLPPHKVAMQQIDQIKAERGWEKEDSKEYYTRLTATLRTYIQERYGFNAMEMTSSEIIDRLLLVQDQAALNELIVLFRTADLVKFAKYNTRANENDMNLINAIEFINHTKLEQDPNQKPEPQIVSSEERRSMRRVWVLRIAIGCVALSSVGLLVWIGYMIFKVLY